MKHVQETIFLTFCTFVKKSRMLNYREKITIDPEIRFGKPCIRGTRISIYDILNWLASGMTHQEIIEDYPELTEDDIIAALSYAAEKEHKIRIAS